MLRPCGSLIAIVLISTSCTNDNDKGSGGPTPVRPVNGQSINAIHGLAENDVWIAAGNAIFHWDGASLTPTFDVVGTCGHSPTKFRSIYEAAPGDVWAADETMTYHQVDGVLTKLGVVDASINSFAGTSNDLWMGSTQLLHWDGSTLTTVALPTSKPPFTDLYDVLLSKSGALWALLDLPDVYDGVTGYTPPSPYHFAKGAWGGAHDDCGLAGCNIAAATATGEVLIAGGATQFADIAYGTLAGPIDQPLASANLFDSLDLISGPSSADFWTAGFNGRQGLLYHSDGSSLAPATYPGTAVPTALFVGSTGWGFLGDQAGELFQLQSGAWVAVTP